VKIAKLQSEQVALILLVVVTVIVLATGATIAIGDTTTQHVVVAAGPSSSESAALMRAVKSVVERHYPNIRMTVAETADVADSLKRLERGEAQLAAAQADASAPPVARLVAVLFEDEFQLLAHKSSNIKQFIDLKGKRIALPVTDSQYQSFLFVASHFGLTAKDFTFVGSDAEGAALAFARPARAGSGYDADALFRVRPILNSSLTHSVDTDDVDLVPISDGQAMHIEMPSYVPSVIPKGAYLGNPTVPSRDIETVSAKHTLVAREDLSDDIVSAITQVLMERRPELGAFMQARDAGVLPLLAQIQRPDASMGLGLGVHPGALDVYRGGKPPWIQTHSDVLFAVVILSALATLWGWVLKRIRERRQNQRLTAYTTRIAELIEEVEATVSDSALMTVRQELMGILRLAMLDLRQEKLSESSFQIFHFAWQFAFASMRERRAAVRNRSAIPAQAAENAPKAVIPAAEKHLWRFSKMLQSKSNG